MIDFCKDFASHIDSSRKKKDQHHKPFKELPIDIHGADPIFPAVIYEKPPFPARIREPEDQININWLRILLLMML